MKYGLSFLFCFILHYALAILFMTHSGELQTRIYVYKNFWICTKKLILDGIPMALLSGCLGVLACIFLQLIG